ncbi:MAG: cytochrome c oxidase assembly factor Coa1 family protein [Acidobacteriota bacterium]|nr:cytochrome c oxidase assembly factor Coa1 family protein [Acidobacteriota bacterium]
MTSPGALRLRFSEPYRLATALAGRHPLVMQHLGVVEGYGPPGGQLDGAGGWCELRLWVQGSRADGRLEVRLDRRGGQWFWGWANLRLEDGQLITLDTP